MGEEVEIFQAACFYLFHTDRGQRAQRGTAAQRQDALGCAVASAAQ